MLRDMGVSAALAHELVKAGWLQRLSRGAYLVTGDVPTRDGTIAFLGRRVPGMHVAGKTALSWQDVRHNIAFRERIILWGQKPYAFPDWVGEPLLYSYQTTKLFDGEFRYDEGLKPLPAGDPTVLVSIPERALLELASDVGKGQTMEEATNLMDGLRNIRPRCARQVPESLYSRKGRRTRSRSRCRRRVLLGKRSSKAHRSPESGQTMDV